MACARGFCTAEKIFIFINIAFAMYSGALLATAARLAWDPSTYAWFRFLCAAQYRVSAAYVLTAGLWLAALVYLAACTAQRAARRSLHAYCLGVACLALSEVGYGAWMAASLAAWWRDAPQAELARRGMDLVHDLKPALLAVERYRDVARPVYDMIEEMERAAPNNAFVIIVFGVVGMVLQVAAFVMARRLAARAAPRSSWRRATRTATRPTTTRRPAGARRPTCACTPSSTRFSSRTSRARVASRSPRREPGAGGAGRGGGARGAPCGVAAGPPGAAGPPDAGGAPRRAGTRWRRSCARAPGPRRRPPRCSSCAPTCSARTGMDSWLRSPS